MKKGWEVKSINQVCLLENGDRGKNYPSKKHRVDKGIPFINAGHFKEEKIDFSQMDYINENRFNLLSNGKIQEKDILFCLRGSLGKFAYVKEIEKGAIASSLVIIRAFSNILHQNWLAYYLKSNICEVEIDKFRNGAAQPNLSAGNLGKFQIPLPPLAEQKRIVAILDEAFAALDKAKANTEKNLANAKELFESYLNGIFANPGEDWEEKKLGDVCNFVRGPFGGSLKKSIFKPSGYAVYEQQHAIYNQFGNIRYFIDEQKFNEMRRFELNAGDLIMSCSGTMGKTAIVPDGIEKGIINQALLKLTPNRKLSVEFLKLWMESNDFQKQINAFSQGAAIQNVASVKILKEIRLRLPSLQKQLAFANNIIKFSYKTKHLEEIYLLKFKDLDELKKSILKKAFEGEL